MSKPQVNVGVSYTRFAYFRELCEVMYNNDQRSVTGHTVPSINATFQLGDVSIL